MKNFTLPGTLVALLMVAPLVSATIPGAVAQDAHATHRLNPNSATPAQLKSVAGLNDELIAEIQKNKPYATMGAFNKVVSKKLSADQAKQVYTALFVPVNLNKASQEDIALIPGITPKMIDEFLEYRPYKDMAQFNREIGKYVNAAELARLASYVTLQ
ncbi:MAG TPA: helix-hairpin-helix domain-containing protein [Rhizomicrobium sp.]|nr:helix-hairpin-helix domain-containing protein [Rhizomicrobium sp.]